MKVTSFLVPVVGVFTVAVMLAQPRKPNQRFPVLVGRFDQFGPIVLRETKHDVSPAVRDMEVVTTSSADSAKGNTGQVNLEKVQPKGTAPGSVDAALRHPASQLVATTAGLNFDGQAWTAGSWLQPDTNGAVGASQFVEWVNVSFSVFDKGTGNLIKGPVLGNTLWQGFGGECETTNSGDPIAQYDKAAGRWVMTQRASPSGGPYYQCVAVSTTSDATGAFNRYAFSLPNDFPDYPKIGVWSDAYYLSIDMETLNPFSHIGPYLCALDRFHPRWRISNRSVLSTRLELSQSTPV